MPELSTFSLEGTIPNLKGKVVLLDFFASWCAPCKASFPAIEELHKQFESEGLVVIAVNVDTTKKEMEAFLRKEKVTFTILRDASQKLVRAVDVPTMPSSFLISRDGKIAYAHEGYKGAETKRQYTEEIKALLKNP